MVIGERPEAAQLRIEISKEKPALLIGGNGNVGKGISRELKNRYGEKSIISASRNSAETQLDITNITQVWETLSILKPSVIFLLTAYTNVNGAEEDPEAAERLNIEGTRNVAIVAEELGIPIIYFSTDFVFPGGRLAARELDPRDPLSVYGETKGKGEEIIRRSAIPNLTLRISYPFYSVEAHLADETIKDTAWWILTTLVSGVNAPAYTNVSGNWTSMDYMMRDIDNVIVHIPFEGSELLHIGGEIATPYDVAVVIRQFLIENGVDESTLGHVIPVEYIPKKRQARRPDNGLNVSKSHNLGFTAYSIIDEIQQGRWLDRSRVKEIVEHLRTPKGES